MTVSHLTPRRSSSCVATETANTVLPWRRGLPTSATTRGLEFTRSRPSWSRDDASISRLAHGDTTLEVESSQRSLDCILFIVAITASRWTDVSKTSTRSEGEPLHPDAHRSPPTGRESARRVTSEGFHGAGRPEGRWAMLLTVPVSVPASGFAASGPSRSGRRSSWRGARRTHGSPAASICRCSTARDSRRTSSTWSSLGPWRSPSCAASSDPTHAGSTAASPPRSRRYVAA